MQPGAYSISEKAVGHRLSDLVANFDRNIGYGQNSFVLGSGQNKLVAVADRNGRMSFGDVFGFHWQECWNFEFRTCDLVAKLNSRIEDTSHCTAGRPQNQMTVSKQLFL